MDPQKPGNSPGPGSKVVERQKDTKTERPETENCQRASDAKSPYLDSAE